jgi:transposase
VSLSAFAATGGWEVSTTEIMDTSLRVKRRHRSWPEALKREIVAASLVPGASVSVVARRYDVNTNLVFTWRKQFGEAPAPAPQLVPVVVTADQPLAATGAAGSALSEGMIEIELPRGYRVRVGGGVKLANLRLVLDALERR